VPEIVRLTDELPQEALGEFLKNGELTLATGEGDVTLDREDMTVMVEGIAPWGGRHEHGIIVALNLEVDDALRLEGIARELVNRLQNLRKKAGFEVSNRIRIRYDGGEVADRVFAAQGEFIKHETLAREAERGAAQWKDSAELEVDGELISLWIERESD
jgi:isoleucyl-tRNA synthetase